MVQPGGVWFSLSFLCFSLVVSGSAWLFVVSACGLCGSAWLCVVQPGRVWFSLVACGSACVLVIQPVFVWFSLLFCGSACVVMVQPVFVVVQHGFLWFSLCFCGSACSRRRGVGGSARHGIIAIHTSGFPAAGAEPLGERSVASAREDPAMGHPPYHLQTNQDARGTASVPAGVPAFVKKRVPYRGWWRRAWKRGFGCPGVHNKLKKTANGHEGASRGSGLDLNVRTPTISEPDLILQVPGPGNLTNSPTLSKQTFRPPKNPLFRTLKSFES